MAEEPPSLGSLVDTFPEKSFFLQAEERITGAYKELAVALQRASQAFRQRVHGALNSHPNWDAVRAAIENTERQFQEACNAKGLTPQEAEALHEAIRELRAKQVAVQTEEAARHVLAKELPDRADLLDKLARWWRGETDVRKRRLETILTSEAMPRTKEKCPRPVVEVQLEFSANKDFFLKRWAELAPDGRTAAGRIWSRPPDDPVKGGTLGDALFDAFLGDAAKGDEAGNPLQWLEPRLDSPDKLADLLREHLTAIKQMRDQKPDKWTELLLTRIPDVADLVLYRADGSEAGSFKENTLSTGQKNTAILSLLLAWGSGPVIVDQPEDELDSEFLFQDLVPMLRKAKLQRQLIIVTHNANIPVNADAELVYALRAENGHGVCLAQGGLDNDDVSKAVLNVMEGSKEAFLRRKEKYHF